MITTCFYPLKIPQQKHPVLNRPHVHSTVHLSWLYLTITPMITWLVPLFHFTPGEIHFDWHMFRLINQNTSRLCNTIKATDLGPQMITHLAIHYFSIFRLSLFLSFFITVSGSLHSELLQSTSQLDSACVCFAEAQVHQHFMVQFVYIPM